MAFEVVEDSGRTLWAPIVDSDTLYVGQIVESNANEGVAPVNAAAGASDTTGKVVPYGVVVGTNEYGESYSQAQQANSITDVTPHDSTVEYVLHEGVWARGDRVAMVEIALITPETILKGPIYNAALGTATVLGTVTTGSASGVSCTVNTLEVSGVAGLGTVYFRSGANQGAYRVTDDTSATAITWDKPTTYDVAIGDTLVRVNLRPIGPSRAQFDTEAMYIDNNAVVTTDYYSLDVIKLDLSEAGKEHCFFKFNADHFCLKRA